MIIANTSANDILNNEVVIGDIVVVATTPWSQAAMLKIMYIAAITKKSIICGSVDKNRKIPEFHMYDDKKKRYMFVPNNDVCSTKKHIITGEIRGENQILKYTDQ